jgi:hypothetical protein
LEQSGATWHLAKVAFEGTRVFMLWSTAFWTRNVRATMLAQQPDTKFHGAIEPSQLEATGDAYLLLSQMWKPYVDISTNLYPTAADFERVARRLLQGWWRAVRTNYGWRIFADNWKELFSAKISIPT